MARILVADDEKLARFTIREILENAGHTVSEAINGNMAISMQKSHPFDMIITDIIMPEKEGIETLIELKKDYPELKIICISGGGRTRNMDFLEVAKQFGADKILAKPFDNDELMECVNACLG